MKRVVIEVPDAMTHTWGSSRKSTSEKVEVDERTIVLALHTNDYHTNWYFADPKSIKVVSLEDIEPEE